MVSNGEKAEREREKRKKMEDSHEAFARALTQIIHMEESLPHRSGGAVAYATRYRQRSTGYKGRPLEDGVAMAKAPRRARAIAYRYLGVRDWDVSMVYFAFDAQAVDKLAIKKAIPYFRLETVKKYIVDRDFFRKSIRETMPATESVWETTRRKVFNGGAICRGYEDNIYLNGLAWANGRPILIAANDPGRSWDVGYRDIFLPTGRLSPPGIVVVFGRVGNLRS